MRLGRWRSIERRISVVRCHAATSSRLAADAAHEAHQGSKPRRSACHAVHKTLRRPRVARGRPVRSVCSSLSSRQSHGRRTPVRRPRHSSGNFRARRRISARTECLPRCANITQEEATPRCWGTPASAGVGRRSEPRMQAALKRTAVCSRGSDCLTRAKRGPQQRVDDSVAGISCLRDFVLFAKPRSGEARRRRRSVTVKDADYAHRASE